MSEIESAFSEDDSMLVAQQLGREPRDVISVAKRCACNAPLVVKTAPRLSDGTPFPTTFYLTCPRMNSAIGKLESSGLMREMESRLASDSELAKKYEEAHLDYLAAREAIASVPEIAHISAGGMPNRIKCLHVLAAHALATGPGVNPFGDEVVGAVGQFWKHSNCAGLASPS